MRTAAVRLLKKGAVGTPRSKSLYIYRYIRSLLLLLLYGISHCDAEREYRARDFSATFLLPSAKARRGQGGTASSDSPRILSPYAKSFVIPRTCTPERSRCFSLLKRGPPMVAIKPEGSTL